MFRNQNKPILNIKHNKKTKYNANVPPKPSYNLEHTQHVAVSNKID